MAIMPYQLMMQESGEVSVLSIKGGRYNYVFPFTNLVAGQTKTFDFEWSSRMGQVITWEASVTPTVNDSNLGNNTLTKDILVVK